MTPYSFTAACALRTKALVIFARSKENVRVFRYFMMLADQKKNWLWIFWRFSRRNSIKFVSAVITGLLYFTWSSCFSGKSIWPFLTTREKTYICKKRTKTEKVSTQPLLFRPDSMFCENCGRFHQCKFQKITIEATWTVENASVWVDLLQD